jgi:hypothetical protein
VCKGNYWGSSMWILTQQVCYLSYVVHSSNTWEKWKYTEEVHHQFVDFKKAYYSVRREIYNIFIDFHIPMKLAITMCLHETYS